MKKNLVILIVAIMAVFFSSCEKIDKEMVSRSRAGSEFLEPSGPYLDWKGASSLSLKSAVTSEIRYGFYVKAIYEDSTDYTIETFNKSLSVEEIMISFLSHTGHGRIIELQAPKDLIVMLNLEYSYVGKKTMMYNLYSFPKEKLVEENKLPYGLLGIITFILGVISGIVINFSYLGKKKE